MYVCVFNYLSSLTTNMGDYQDIICFAVGVAAFFYFTRPNINKCQQPEQDYRFIEDYEILQRGGSESPISLETKMARLSLKEWVESLKINQI